MDRRIDLKEILLSVLNEGEKSSRLKSFITVCASIAIACFKKSKFKKEVMNVMPHSYEDIAADLIGDLFKCENGKFIYIDKYFCSVNINELHEDILESKLFSLVYSRTNQRITKIRIENGEYYFNVDKSLSMELKRHQEIYSIKKVNEKILIYKNSVKNISFEKPLCPENVMLEVLFGKRYKTAEIPEILNYLFEFLNNQDEYCEALEKESIANLITNFYKKRSAHI